MGTKDTELGDEQLALSLLSPQERAAMADDDEIDALKEIAGAGDDNDDAGSKAGDKGDKGGESNEDEEEEGEEEEQAAAGAPAPTPTPAPNDDADQQASAQKTDSEEQEFRPVYKADPVEGYAEKLSALDASKADAFQKLMDGEITAKDYAVAEAKYLADREALMKAQTKAEMAVEMKDQAAEQQWRYEVAREKRAAKADGVDYEGDQKLHNAWDKWVKTLAADPENGDKDGAWFLKEATRMVKIQYGLGNATPTPAPTPAPANKNKARAPDLSKLPPSLGKLPAADESDAGDGGEFAHLEKLTGMALENALARMSQEQQDRYLQS